MFETNIQSNSPLISLARAAQLTGYHQDYLGQLCRIGKLPATKKGRNWFTSAEALNKLSSIVDPVNDSIETETSTETLEEPEQNDQLEFSQPEIAQTVTVSQVEGMPIVIRTLPAQIRSTNSVQSILTAMRIESLQREVLELRQMLARLMAEVANHTNILEGRVTRSDHLRHSYISNFDFNAPYSGLNLARQNEDIPAAIKLPALNETITEPAQSRYPVMVWVSAAAVSIVVALMLTSMITGQFFGPAESQQVSSVYYQTPLHPTVAGDTLPTEQAGDLLSNVVQ